MNGQEWVVEFAEEQREKAEEARSASKMLAAAGLKKESQEYSTAATRLEFIAEWIEIGAEKAGLIY